MSIYITYIERESCFVRVWGQQDKNVALFIEEALMQMKPRFDAGVGLLPADQLQPGVLCCAKFKDDAYYRAHITSVAMRAQGMLEVLFIDYGNRDLVQVAAVRSMYSFPTSVISLPPQAKDFVLARVQCGTAFPDPGFEIIANEIRYLDFEFQYVGQVGPYSLLVLTAGGLDITRSFIERQLAIPVDLNKQCMMLQSFVKPPPNPFVAMSQSPPAMLMTQQQRSPPMQMHPPQQLAPTSPTTGNQLSFLTYKSLPLKVGSEHTVYVSYVTEGPCLFSIQLQNKEHELQELMVELNKLPLMPIEENILPGYVCLARSLEDNYICRAVVTNMVEDKYKVFFVDFGNTEVRSFDNLFQIPFKYVIPKVMATRFALNGLQGQVVSVDMKIAFKNFVDNKAMKMRVCPALPNTGVPLCDIWNAEGVSALDYVRGASLQAYPAPVPLSRGVSQEVKVSFVFSCVRFYVQLRKKETELTEMMQKLQTAAMRTITPELLKVNAPCIALYEADGMYYRAQIVSIEGGNVLVRYVDFGNEENVTVANIRAPIADFITNLRPQAIECCLNGYQNMELDQERDNLLEELMLEQYFSMRVVDVQGSRILVDLMDAQMYNVASLLLERMAKNRSQVSPALVQDNKIDHRRTTPTKYSPRDNTNKTDSWRDNNRPPQQHNRSPPNNTDWRQNKELPECNNEYRKKVHANFHERNNRNSADGEPAPFQENRRQNTWNNRAPRDGNSAGSDGGRPPKFNNQWDENENKQRSDSNWDENKKQNNSWGGGDRGDRRENSRENTWGDNKRDQFNNKHNNFSERKDNTWGDNKRENFNNKHNNFSERKDNTWGDNKRENFNSKRENSFEKTENSTWGDKRPDREFRKRAPREDNTWGGGGGGDDNYRKPRRDNRSEDGSEKSFHSGKSFKGKRDNFGASPPKNNDENVDYAQPNEQFTSMEVTGTEHKVSTSWFYNPASFFVQLLDDKAKFDAIMKDIQFAYKRRTPLETANIGDSAIALFPEDKALYRARVIEEPIGGNFKVNYVDFGNSGVTSKIYKVERRFMELPAQAVHCGLTNVHPAGAQWAKAAAFGKYFGAGDLSCKFEGFSDDKYMVELTLHGTSVREELQKAGLIIVKNPYQHYDITYLLSQQIYSKLHSVQSLDQFSLEILPGLVVACTVFKHDIATTPNLELLKSYLGQMVIAYVDDVQDNKAIVTLYDSCGKFLPVIELQEEMFENVNPICPSVIIGPKITGYVAHATPTSVFVQAAESAANVEVLLEQLYTRYETSQEVDIEVKEAIYAVRSSDANWYRGLVKSVNGEEITVQFIDYGNEEIVNKSVIRTLTADFFTPYLATEIELPQAETYQDQEISLQIYFGEEKWIGEVVQTSDTPLTQPAEAIQEETHTMTTCTTPPVEAEAIPETIPEETVGEEYHPAPDNEQYSGQYLGFSVELSHLDNPGQFYLQQSAALDAINELQDVLQPQIETLADIENITTGILCAAPYSVDQVWYRAQVLDADSDITTVRFIDFGNTDVLGSNIKIKTLSAELLSLEEHAKRCSLHLSPKDSEWTSEACKRFEDLTTNVALTAEIVHQDEKTTFVRLYADSVCINDVFLQEGFATELQEAPAALTGFVSNLNSPSEFWLQFEHACGDLEMIAEQLVSADKFTLLEDQAPGSLCAAIFPEDESWYRARILSNTVAGVEVLFIDYGNSCTCTSLRELPEDLVMVPAMAHKCSLYKPQGLLEWSAKATEKFKEISADGVTVFTVVKHSQGETNHVQLFFNDEDVSEILRPELAEVKILSCNGLGDFSLRKVDLEEKLMEVQSKIQDLSEKPDANETIVVALYGAVVDKFVVDLLDLGIEADVSELRQLPKELIALEPFAMSVKMSPLVGYVFNEESETYFKTLCANTGEIFHAEFAVGKWVRLYQNGCDVRDKMPMTKCTPINSLQNTPKKVKTVNADIAEVRETRTEDQEGAITMSLEDEMREVVNKLADNVGGGVGVVEHEQADANTFENSGSDQVTIEEEVTETKNEGIEDHDMEVSVDRVEVEAFYEVSITETNTTVLEKDETEVLQKESEVITSVTDQPVTEIPVSQPEEVEISQKDDKKLTSVTHDSEAIVSEPDKTETLQEVAEDLKSITNESDTPISQPEELESPLETAEKETAVTNESEITETKPDETENQLKAPEVLKSVTNESEIPVSQSDAPGSPLKVAEKITSITNELEVTVSKPDATETLQKDVEMITSVTDDLIDRVSKQCNLTPVQEVLRNGSETVKAEPEKADTTQKIAENDSAENVS